MTSPPSPSSLSLEKAQIIAKTVVWLERAVIGLNLCPFAKAEHIHGRIHYEVSAAKDGYQLMRDLGTSLELLLSQPPEKIETLLLIHPQAFEDFLDYNDFLVDAEELLAKLDLEGVVQIASFHPQYQFEGTEPEDIENYTNRSPYPMLHLLREDSLERAVESFPDTDTIFERNIETMKKLGLKRWQELFADQA
jgi:uncharacterized protein